MALFARTCPLWPAVAVESGATLSDVLAATRGRAWRVLGCVLAVALPFSMLDRMVKASDRTALTDPGLRALRVAAAGCLDTVSLVLGAAVLAEIYRRLTARP